MVTALVLLLGVIALVRRAPDLPLSRLLDEWLARRPAAWLLRRTRRELIAWAIVAVLFAFAGEYVLLMDGPQLALGFAVDLGAYIDAVIAVTTIASVARVRVATRWLVRAGKIAGVSRPRSRSPRRSRVRPPANDDADRPGWSIAA